MISEYVHLYDKAVEQMQSAGMPQLQEEIERFLSRKESFETCTKLMGVMRDAEKRAPYA